MLTSGRQDWGILRSTCKLLHDDARFKLSLWSGGMHESARFGHTRADVDRDGFDVHEGARVDRRGDDDGASLQAARALEHVAGAIARRTPDVLVLAGDRFETASAALAATLAAVPIVHLHGGEETEGAFDNALRHAISKLAHLHLVSCEAHAARVRQMGEPARVCTSSVRPASTTCIEPTSRRARSSSSRSASRSRRPS